MTNIFSINEELRYERKKETVIETVMAIVYLLATFGAIWLSFIILCIISIKNSNTVL